MPEARKRPCSICRRWFRPDPRVGDRQHACGKPECQTTRRRKTQASWRGRNPGYSIAYRIDHRSAPTQPAPEVLRVPAPLNQLPWEFAKDQFGPQRVDFIAVLAALLVRFAKDQFRVYRIDPTRLSGTLPRSSQKTSPSFVRRQLFLWVGDNYFSRPTTTTLYRSGAKPRGRLGFTA